MDDRELVAAVRDGDDAAYEELYRRYSRRVAGYVCRMVGDPDRAEDITQEAFFSALRRLRRTDADITFKPWIFEIAKNASIDHFRRTSRAEEVSIHAEAGGLRPADHLRLVGGGPAPEAAYEGKERLDLLRGAFDELSDSHSRILVLRELEGLSYREIGERMDLTRPAVESTLFRARRRLNEEYSDLDTGARCEAVGAAIARMAEGVQSARDRRRVGRHAARCSACRRHARELGVSVEMPARSRVAALLPIPVLARRRRGDAHDGGTGVAAGGSGFQQVASTWAPAIVTTGAAEGTAHAWSKAAALVATLALAGGGAAIHDRLVEPDRGVPPAQTEQVAPAAGERGDGGASGGTARPGDSDRSARPRSGGRQERGVGSEARRGGAGGDVRLPDAPRLGSPAMPGVAPPEVGPPDVGSPAVPPLDGPLPRSGPDGIRDMVDEVSEGISRGSLGADPGLAGGVEAPAPPSVRAAPDIPDAPALRDVPAAPAVPELGLPAG